MQTQELIRQPMSMPETNQIYLPIQEMLQAIGNADSELAERSRQNEETMARLFQQMQATIEELTNKNRDLSVELESSKSRYSEANKIHEAEVLALNNELTTARNGAQSSSAIHQQQSQAYQNQIAQYQMQALNAATTKHNAKQTISTTIQAIKQQAQQQVVLRQNSIAQIAGKHGSIPYVQRTIIEASIPPFSAIDSYSDIIINTLNTY